MQISQVQVEVGLTLCPKQYESVKVHSIVTVQLSYGEDPQEALTEAARWARKQCEIEAAKIIQDNWGKK